MFSSSIPLTTWKHGQILQWMALQWGTTYLVYAFGIVCRNGEADKQILKLRFSEKAKKIWRERFLLILWPSQNIWTFSFYQVCKNRGKKGLNLFSNVLFMILSNCMLRSVRLYICSFKTFFLSYIFIEHIFTFFDFYVLNKAFKMVTR